jgi:hypothetical protein
MKYFYADKDNKPVGPLPREALESLKTAGIINDSTMVIEEGASEWKKFSDALMARSAPPPPPPPPQTETHVKPNAEAIATRNDTYKELGNIAQAATTKLLQPFIHPSDEDRNAPVEEMLLSFLIYADDFTEACCQQFANTLRRTSVLPEVRGTPTTGLARQIREECFAKTDRILASYLEALQSCHIDLKVAAGRLQETSVLGAALRGAAVGQLAGGLGKAGATLGIFSAVIDGIAESDRQTGLLWEQRKAQADAKRVAGNKMVEYLTSVKQVTETLLDFACAKCFGGGVDFQLQSAALADAEKAISNDIAAAIAKATELSGLQDDTRQIEDETAKGPPSGIPESCLNAYKTFLGKEGRTAVIYGFKCQIGLKSGLQLDAAVTNQRVWIGGVKPGGTEVVQVLELPFSQLQFICQQSKNTIFSGQVSRITLKWGGFLQVAILDSPKEQGEYFYQVLKRRVAAENGACTIS